VRILIASDQWSPDVVGGSARVAADTARALAERGHEIVVLAPAHPGSADVEEDRGVEVRRVIRRGLIPQTLTDPVSTRHRARALRARSFDVLVAHQVTNAAGLLSAFPTVPLALVFHASPVLELRFLRSTPTGRPGVARSALGPILAILERRAYRDATGILVLSRFSERLVRTRHPGAADRTHVVGGGVDDLFFSGSRNADKCRRRHDLPPGLLLFTARRLEPRMGVDHLIEALSLLDDEVVLAVAGDGSLREDLARRVDLLGLTSRVRLLGKVSEEDLRGLYAAADLFVLPTIAYEGFGMSTVEALAAGTPTIGTAIGATPEIVGALGPEFIAPTDDASGLAGAIRRVVPLLGPELRARARELADERFRWSRAIVRWEQALATIAGR
jgi:glycosyltransferase involved in cell wall biosynthesis